jgi:glutamyl/glutaminyl-tRNA synthetase
MKLEDNSLKNGLNPTVQKQDDVSNTVKGNALGDAKMLKKIAEIEDMDEWVTFIIKADLTPQRKGYLTRLWLKTHGFTKESLEKVRRANKLWKTRACRNTFERRKKLETMANEKNSRKPWTEAELEKLRENIDKTEAELIKIFRRSLQSINSKKRKIRMELSGIDTSRTGQPWNEKEIEKLKKNIALRNLDLAIMLRRSTQSIQGKKKELRQKTE